jgi:hypothetical protein
MKTLAVAIKCNKYALNKLIQVKCGRETQYVGNMKVPTQTLAQLK